MDNLLKDCIDKITTFSQTVDYQNKQQLNAYISIYDKLKEIIEIIEDNDLANDVLEKRIAEAELEEDILKKFGPSILLYLIMKTAEWS